MTFTLKVVPDAGTSLGLIFTSIKSLCSNDTFLIGMSCAPDRTSTVPFEGKFAPVILKIVLVFFFLMLIDKISNPTRRPATISLDWPEGGGPILRARTTSCPALFFIAGLSSRSTVIVGGFAVLLNRDTAAAPLTVTSVSDLRPTPPMVMRRPL